MPVHYSVITSKRARRARRLSGCRIEPPSTSESRRLARRIESVLGSSEPRSSPQAGSVPSQSPTVNSTDALCTKSAMMSTWQQEANTAIQTGEVMENGNTATLNNTEAAPNSPPKPDLQSGVERSFQRRRSFSKFVCVHESVCLCVCAWSLSTSSFNAYLLVCINSFPLQWE